MTSTYRSPVPVLARLVQDDTPSLLLSSCQTKLLTYDHPSHLSLVDVSSPEIRVAGMRFNPQTRSNSRVRWSTKADIKHVDDLQAESVSLQLPGKKARGFEFSKDSKFVGFFVKGEGGRGTDVFCADTDSGEAFQCVKNVNQVLCKGFRWCGRLLVCPVVGRLGEAPKAPDLPRGPVVKEHHGEMAKPARTYHDLLESEYDEEVFVYYTHSLIQVCDAVTGDVATVDFPEKMITSLQVSPDERFLLVEMLCAPYSNSLPASRFSKQIVVLEFEDALFSLMSDQKPLKPMHVFDFATIPVQEDLSTSFDARLRGPRDVEFAWNEPHTVAFVQALDDGEPSKPSPHEKGHRDALMFCRQPPFAHSLATTIFTGEARIDSVWWTDAGGPILVLEDWYKTRMAQMFVVWDDGQRAELLYSRSSDDAYSSWGSPRAEYSLDTGYWRCKTRPSDGALLLIGEGASPNGNRPFVDYLTLDTKTRERVWRCPAGPKNANSFVLEPPESEPKTHPVVDENRRACYQRPLDVLYARSSPFFLDRDVLLAMVESPEEPPNLALISIDEPSAQPVHITTFPHPQPELLGVKKELVRYKRSDGVELSADLYTPPGFDGKRLPLLCWAYPMEFKNKTHASQVKSSPHRFIFTSWHRPTLWLSRGFAVLDNFSVPIVAEGAGEPNDSFVEQLVESAKAAVDECVARGVADPDRVAVGGHSYGAYMVATLLAHSRLFKAGIARSGAYNRTLTPFGYQSEERTMWTARDMYLKNSPFAFADKIQAPILFIHGEDDQNVGTHLMQTERMFSALQGLGKKARMVVLPCERHSYDALESVLHCVYEQDVFLEKHVLNISEEEKRARI